MEKEEQAREGNLLDSLLNEIGLSREEANDLVDGEPPEPADEERIRATFRGEVDWVEKKKVAELIEIYRAWRDAALRVAQEESELKGERDKSSQQVKRIVDDTQQTGG